MIRRNPDDRNSGIVNHGNMTGVTNQPHAKNSRAVTVVTTGAVESESATWSAKLAELRGALVEHRDSVTGYDEAVRDLDEAAGADVATDEGREGARVFLRRLQGRVESVSILASLVASALQIVTTVPG
ncbi:hypothetical protein ACFYWS_25315 [Streptomyces sp. NPDC002795]|uniref:hypothetical protein n=1 Tax=Streptomyces sp. NPDC002795 TaxID=3364665 RepID=UPI00368348AA